MSATARNRLLVTATPEPDETYAEVAHEAVFKRWEKLRDWIAAEREFLAWKTGLEAARRAWQATPKEVKTGALLMGAFLTKAQSWVEKRGQDLPIADQDFIAQNTKRENKATATAPPRPGPRLCAPRFYNRCAHRLDQPIIHQRAVELVDDRAALYGHASSAPCADPGE